MVSKICLRQTLIDRIETIFTLVLRRRRKRWSLLPEVPPLSDLPSWHRWETNVTEFNNSNNLYSKGRDELQFTKYERPSQQQQHRRRQSQIGVGGRHRDRDPDLLDVGVSSSQNFEIPNPFEMLVDGIIENVKKFELPGNFFLQSFR